MTITINGQSYSFEVRSWWGPMYKFEDIMDVANHPERKYNPLLTFHMHVMFYAVLMCENENLTISIDEFLDALDDIRLANSMRDYYVQRISILLPSSEHQEAEKSAKKKS